MNIISRLTASISIRFEPTYKRADELLTASELAGLPSPYRGDK